MTRRTIINRASLAAVLLISCVCASTVHAGLLDKLKKSLDEVKQTVDQTNQTVNEAAKLADDAANIKNSATELVPSAVPPANTTTNPPSVSHPTQQAVPQPAQQVTPKPIQQPVQPSVQQVAPVTSPPKATPAASAVRDAKAWQGVKDMSGYFVLGSQLWNIDTREMVDDNWRGGMVRPIADMPGSYWSAQDAGSTAKPAGAMGYPLRFDAVNHKRIDPFAIYVTSYASTPSNTWLSLNRRTFAQLKEGDVWRGEIDWVQGAVKSLVNVTNVGLLAKSEPILWYGNDLYLRRTDATTKPIVKVNMQTGALTEMPDSRPFAGMYGSPNGRFKYASDLHGLHVYDAKTGESFVMATTREVRLYGGVMKERPEPIVIEGFRWVNEHTFFSPLNSSWVDLDTRETLATVSLPKILADIPAQITGRLSSGHIPGGEHIDIVFTGARVDSNGAVVPNSGVTRRYRINRLTREVVDLPVEEFLNTSITWIDVNRYVIARDTGGLNEVGTWLYDVRTGAYKRLSSFPAAGSGSAVNSQVLPGQTLEFITPNFSHNLYLAMPERNRVGFNVNRGGKAEYHVVSLDGGEPWILDMPKGQGGMVAFSTRVLGNPLRLLSN